MPTAEQILVSLGDITSQWHGVAVGWHVYFAVVALIIVAGMRPSRRLMGLLLSLPMFSVSALAWHAANPFNTLVFALAGAALIAVALWRLFGVLRLSRGWPAVAGALLFAFGWVYPHFLDGASWYTYLYAAPVGLVPCPTLSMIIGLSLLLEGLASRAWMWLLALIGGFYGVFGALHLQVVLDWVLLAGATALLLYAKSAPRPRF
ncbi:hypothetical protein Tel_15440 [Candidatus Tenderia electrophaga]|jgi:hypothetical protein|uniref:Uncharacterized protein n=1 Tax=Candidatus Tenderia electrophaga TaxID=1748243 RepID=A0A0S2TH03_9GAMM|nr:hypothetical protein Tel_15440 [Candidatus Tenderia electrophaga]